MGNVLASRSGLRSATESLEYWAAVAAKVEHETGRSWRNMQDTADSVPVTMSELFLSPPGWDSWLRVLDYYEEGALLWLEVNAIIVQQTHGGRSLDDFFRLFYAQAAGSMKDRTFTEQDVFNALTKIALYDWKGFFRERLTLLPARAPLEGLARSGWKLIYDSQPNTFLNAARANGLGATMNSVGFTVGSDGTISDVLRNGRAYLAGLVPGMRVTMVNGKPGSPTHLLVAISASTPSSGAIRLETQFAGVSQQFTLQYHEGSRYPHLERLASRPDLLTPLFQAQPIQN